MSDMANKEKSLRYWGIQMNVIIRDRSENESPSIITKLRKKCYRYLFPSRVIILPKYVINTAFI